MGDRAFQSRRKTKVEVFNEVLCRLRELDVEKAAEPGFEDELWAHFSLLPLRYALDVNTEQAMDVLMHKKLLDMALDPLTRPAVDVRLVQWHSCCHKSDAQEGIGVALRLGNHTFIATLHEITIATKDKPRLLTGLTQLLSEIGLSIQEAHAFCSIDGHSLVVFVVDGGEKGIDHLRSTLVKEIPNIEVPKHNHV